MVCFQLLFAEATHKKGEAKIERERSKGTEWGIEVLRKQNAFGKRFAFLSLIHKRLNVRCIHERRKYNIQNRIIPFKPPKKCVSLKDFFRCVWRKARQIGRQSLQRRQKMSIDKQKVRKQQQEKRNRNKNVLLIINAFLWFHSRSSCLNRQIYYCIQFAVYGILRERRPITWQLFFSRMVSSKPEK